MTWTVIARKEFREARASRLVRLLSGLFVLVCAIGGYVFPLAAGTEGPVTTNRFGGYMTDSVGVLLPLIGILLGYRAIVDERTSGTLALVLSMPYRRRDVVVGKLVGRTLVLAVAVVAALAIAGALVVYPFGSLSLGSAGRYLGYVALTLLFGLVYVGIAIAISAFAPTKHVATAGAFGVFFLFVVAWEAVRNGLELGLSYLGLLADGPPDWLLFVHGAEPGTLYERLVAAFVEGDASGPYLGPDAPWYLGEWVALVLFLAWAVVPIAIGYRRFRGADL